MATSNAARDFRVPAVIHTGRGAIGRLPEVLRAHGARRAALITDRGMAASPWIARLRTLADAADVELTVFRDIEGEPTTQDVAGALDVVRAAGADVVIGFGGGSALDTAKCAAALTANPGPVTAYEGYEKFAHGGLPVIALPTTAGTGSEVTRGVAITDTARSVKMLLMSSWLVPAAAIVDPEPTFSMPKAVTASTGLDALTHAIEAYVSRRRQPLTDPLALDAMGRIARHLVRAYDTPDDGEAREQMCLGSLLAGMAFHNASVALVHGMSRPIGAYFHVPHGLSNAMLLPAVLAFSVPGDPARYADVARRIGAAEGEVDDATAAQRGVQRVTALAARLQVPTPTAWGIDRAEFRRVAPQMARDALASGSPANNPRLATEAEIVALYEQVIAA